jgi:hypothetical protein
MQGSKHYFNAPDKDLEGAKFLFAIGVAAVIMGVVNFGAEHAEAAGIENARADAREYAAEQMIVNAGISAVEGRQLNGEFISSAIDYCVNMDYRHEGGMFDFFSTAYMRSRIRNLEVLQGCTRIMVADANSLHEEIRQAWAEEH